MKHVILHVDGMADHPRKELDGRTPFQTASTPHLDHLVQGGEIGLLAAVPENVRQGSGLTGTTFLGYDPKKYYPGPGPFEAASLGIAIGEHDVVYRCTMVTLRADVQSGGKGGLNEIKKLGPHVVMDDATAGLISTEEARELIEAINEQLGSEMIQFYPGLGHRHLMVWVDGKSRAVCTDPQLSTGRSIVDALPVGDGSEILRKLMDASFQILRDHPLNEERLAAGQEPEMLDKEYLRLWINRHCKPYEEPIPPIPGEVLAELSARYVRVCEALTGEKLALRARLEEAQRTAIMAREYVMATETKLDVIEAALQVLDQRTRQESLSRL